MVSCSSCINSIALGIVLAIINRKIAEKASTALPIISVVAISLILAIVVGGSKNPNLNYRIINIFSSYFT